MKTKMKMFPSLPLYIVTTVVALGCVSALPSARKHHPRALFRVPEQDPGILPSMPEQDYGILPRVPEQDYGVLPSVPEQDYGLQSDVTKLEPRGILENIEKAVLSNPCPDGWTKFDNYCYLVSSDNVTWDKAQNNCKDLDAGLVKIDSAEENQFVLNLVKKEAPSLKQVWIGLKYFTNDFYWYDLSALDSNSYNNWPSPHGPSEKRDGICARMWIDVVPGALSEDSNNAAGGWSDLSCTEFHRGSVCERLP